MNGQALERDVAEGFAMADLAEELGGMCQLCGRNLPGAPADALICIDCAMDEQAFEENCNGH